MTTILLIQPPHEPDEVLQARYKNDPVFKELADKIHHNRMMAGPTCEQCMEMAAAQLEAKNAMEKAKKSK